MSRFPCAALALFSLSAARANAEDVTFQFQGADEIVPVAMTPVGATRGMTGEASNALKAFLAALPEFDDRPEATLFRLANSEGKKFWMGRLPAAAAANQQLVLDHFDQGFQPRGMRCKPLTRKESLLGELLQDADSVDLVEASQGIAAFFRWLTPERVSLDGPAWFKRCLGHDRWANSTIFFVDPTRYAAPESEVYVVQIQESDRE